MIEETTAFKKTSTIIFGIKYKQLRCEKYLYHVFIIVWGMTASQNQLLRV